MDQTTEMLKFHIMKVHAGQNPASTLQKEPIWAHSTMASAALLVLIGLCRPDGRSECVCLSLMPSSNTRQPPSRELEKLKSCLKTMPVGRCSFVEPQLLHWCTPGGDHAAGDEHHDLHQSLLFDKVGARCAAWRNSSVHAMRVCV